jgi:hypothetical protein
MDQSRRGLTLKVPAGAIAMSSSSDRSKNIKSARWVHVSISIVFYIEQRNTIGFKVVASEIDYHVRCYGVANGRLGPQCSISNRHAFKPLGKERHDARKCHMVDSSGRKLEPMMRDRWELRATRLAFLSSSLAGCVHRLIVSFMATSITA